MELPGIEPAPEMALACGNVEFDCAKRREITCRYAAGVDEINTAVRNHLSVPQELLPEPAKGTRTPALPGGTRP